MNMNIYLLYLEIDDVLTCGLADETEIDPLDFQVNNFNGARLPPDWELPRHEIYGGRLPQNDFIYGYSKAPFASERAKDALEPIIKDQAEFRAIGPIKGVKYYVMNVINLLDSLDFEKSRISYGDDGRVMSVHAATFKTDKIPPGTSTFKVPQDTESIYVTDAFVDCVRKHQLTGVGFEYPDKVGVALRYDAFPDLPIKRKKQTGGHGS